jgi:hypothetical protein
MFETAIPGAGYGYGGQHVGPQGPYGNLPGQFGQSAGGYPTGAPQSLLPLTMGPGSVPFQQIQPQFGQQQFGQPQFGQPQFGQPQFGQPQFGQQQFGQAQFGQQQFGQPQFGQQQFGQPQFGQPQLGIQQLGLTQPPVQVIPVVTPQGWFGLLLLATGQPLVIGATVGGISGGLGQHALGGFGGPGGYLPLQAQQQIPQQIPQMYQPVTPFGVPTFPGQPFGGMPIH